MDMCFLDLAIEAFQSSSSNFFKPTRNVLIRSFSFANAQIQLVNVHPFYEQFEAEEFLQTGLTSNYGFSCPIL